MAIFFLGPEFKKVAEGSTHILEIRKFTYKMVWDMSKSKGATGPKTNNNNNNKHLYSEIRS